MGFWKKLAFQFVGKERRQGIDRRQDTTPFYQYEHAYGRVEERRVRARRAVDRDVGDDEDYDMPIGGR